MDWMIFGTLFAGVLACLYIWIKRRLSYWERQGVPKPSANIQSNFLKPKENFNHFFRNVYQEQKGKAPICGFYIFGSPIALALDIEFIKSMLIKDFQYFQERGMYFNEKDDPISAHLFALNYDKWHNLRSKLSPTFTSGKMKFMFPTVADVAVRFKKCLDDLIDDSIDIEIRDLMARYTTDVIGTCAFGIECNSLGNPEAEFRQMGRKVFDKPRYSQAVQGLFQTFPNLSRMLGVKVFRDDLSEFFINIVSETIKLRERSNIQRNDFMDLLINLKNNEKDPLTFNEIAAQAFLFFLAGFETSSTTLQYVFYELAMNPQVQTKLREEIVEILEKNEGKFTYEGMMSMHYLDHVLNETLRKHPPFGALIREVTKTYKIPNSEIVLAKGTNVIISAYAIQHDEEFFPEPEKFIPERFTPEQLNERPSVSFLSFGDGPRNCVGLRFGMMQMRVALVALMPYFEFLKCDKTPEKIIHNIQNVVMVPEGGMWLKIKKLKK